MAQVLAPPNGELVAQAWAAKYTGIPANLIAGSLPSDPGPKQPGNTTLWTTFLTIRALPAGNPHPELSEQRGTVVQVDGWARRPTSTKPQWGAALTLLERVRAATFRDNQMYGRPVEMPVSGYMAARVHAAYLVTEPTRVEKDPSGYAHVTADLAIDWTA